LKYNGFNALITLLFTLICTASFGADEQASKPASLRVMSFNLWHGGDAGKQPLEQTAAVIKAAKADIVGLQETHGYEKKKDEPRPDHAEKLAAMLGWHYLDQGGRTGIISRYKIVANTPMKWGAKIQLEGGQSVWHFNAHFAPTPYQPYQLLNIPYFDAPFIKTAEQAVNEAKKARSKQVSTMLEEVKAHATDGAAIFITGDFNEPSHLDWTTAVAKAGKCPLPVEWPTTKAVMDAGFLDAIRVIHPDPLTRPAHTWTPITDITDAKDRHDRIDFVFARGKDIRITAAQIVGESKASADIIVSPYPSDHRAVVVEVRMSKD